MVRGFNLKLVAICLMMLFIFQIAFPTVSFALTGGPGQPEVSTFEPIGTTQMVDLYSGDFNYNIPLLNVPGSNGSYPINIAYHAGVGMEQEASWVGLGWNINPGAIVRQMRGIPDDFNGDEVIKDFSIKKDWTIGVGAGTKFEILGADLKKILGNKAGVNLNLYYNSYRGVGYKAGVNFSNMFNGGKSSKETKNPITGGLGLNFDSQGGLSVQPSLSFNKAKEERENSFTIGPTIHSTQGLREIGVNYSASKLKNETTNEESGATEYDKSPTPGAGFSLSNPGYIPGIQSPMFSSTFTGSLSITGANAGTLAGSNFNFSYSETKIRNKTKSVKAYGTIYQEGAKNVPNAIMDFNREKEGEISKESPYTHIPVRTNDVYSIQGQGIGGAFRAFRSDVGQLKDPTNKSEGIVGTINVELGFPSPAGVEVGADGSIGYSKSYSGPWQKDNHSISQLNRYESTSKSSLKPKYENFYFKSNGEKTSTKLNEIDRIGKEEPIAFDMGLHFEKMSLKPKVKNTGKGVGNIKNQSERTKRNQHIEYFTKKELGLSNSSTTGKDHHIFKMEVRNPDGNLYSYGLPAYNTKHKDVSFSVEAPAKNGMGNITKEAAYDYNEKLVYYNSTGSNPDNSHSNNKGEDNYFSSTSIPAYTHAHMITEIKSADYVDVKGDGVTDDDFGFWTKFEYDETVTNYKWRFPYEQNKANYSRGYYSNTKDDKGSYSYGEKDLKYLQRVETNTHFAIFTLEDREDGISVADENGGIGSKKQKLLRKVSLYSKKDPSNPIKEVHFEYDYSLCQGIPSRNTAGGKLTLKKIYFTHLNNNKGSLTPYAFDYDPSSNADYQPLESDRWGNYQSSPIGGHENFVDNPYSRQSENYTTRDAEISAWNLTKINLPSGGEINVNYESDDYLYVQNKLANQMFEIVGFSDKNTVLTSLTGANQLSTNKRRVYFKPNKTTITTSEVKSYIKGIKDLYFKAFMKLKKDSDGVNHFEDYVTGYAPIDTESGGVTTIGSQDYGYFNLKTVDYKGKTKLSIFKANPIQMAGWRYMRYQRPDIFNEYGKGIKAAINSVKRLIGDVGSIIAGYYNKAKVAGHCSEIDLNGIQKSYVRLNSTTKKYGGGHRVSSIKISSGWDSQEYGQEYSYVLEDGVTSSGVAEYEPMTGGDEISLRLPKYYDKKKFLIFKTQESKEEPYGESYFPGAKVGYSRVVVRNIKNSQIIKAQTGVSVNEFNTAKDFPVVVRKSGETVKRKGYNINLLIPLIGNQSFSNNGYSNGYTIIVNDMAGKPKSVATYPYKESDTKFTGNPVSATYYTYQTKTSTDKDGDKILVLDNEVKVLDDHGQTRQAKIGESFDFYLDQAEHSSFSLNVGINANANLVGILPIPSLFPSVEFNQSAYRHVITNKVIFRNGILQKVENITDGASVIAKNEIYDAETGQVLLTSSNNEHNKPIYNYTYPAHWAYDRMSGAYENYRAILKPISASSGVYELPTSIKVEDIVKLGDKIALSSNFNTCGWVTDIDVTNNKFTVLNKFNQTTNFSTNQLTIIKSGNSNMQSVSNGNIVSFENPTNFVNYNGKGKLAIYSFLNEAFDNGKTTTFTKEYCGTTYKFDISATTQEYKSSNVNAGYPNGNIIFVDPWIYYTAFTIDITDANSGEKICDKIELAHSSMANTPNAFDFDTVLANYRFDLSSWTQSTAYPFGNIKINYIGGKNIGHINFMHSLDKSHCSLDCEESVYPILQASAIEFSEDWEYNYSDVGNPENEAGDLLENHTTTVSPDLNPYYYGQKGVWRTLRSWAYQENRKQTGSEGNKTRIDKDGQFDFTPFNWITGKSGNANWTWASEITQYSPYGYQLENMNALGIYSSEMYGYENTAVIAVGSNAQYEEIAYDGFETNNTATATANEFSHGLQGHLFSVSNSTDLVSHTGEFSMYTEDGLETHTPNVTLIPGEKYILSAWTYTKNGGNGSIKVNDGNTNPTATIINKNKEIDGWTKIEIMFVPTSTNVTLDIGGSSHYHIYFDDIRISPFNSGMKTYVYNPKTLWLVAELDNLNYATFYSYDEEGSLVKIFKETNQGKKLIKETRNNTQK